jgi:sporulation protein YlmC with PRC-barrel domain
MRRFLTDTAIVAALAVAAGMPALAQQGATSQQQQQQQGTAARGNVDVVFDSEVSLDEWGYGGLYEGTWAAQQLLDAPVYGPTGDEIGEVENVLVGTNGTVEGIIAEVGGFWDIGDTHVRVPWSEVEVAWGGEDEPRVTIPVTEETVEGYDLYGGVAGEFRVVDDDDPYTPRSWRVTELIDDYVTLEGGARYGWVEDLLFDQAGRLKAVVVDAAYGPAYGPYAYPFFGYGYGFYPGYDYYDLPYSEDEIAGAGLEPFEYERFETAEAADD